MKQLFLVCTGTPATLEEELDAFAGGIRCTLAQGTEQLGVEVGYARRIVVKDRRAVWDHAVSLTKPTTVFTANDHRAARDETVSLTQRTGVLTAKDEEG